jgi:hypothetical protein
VYLRVGAQPHRIASAHLRDPVQDEAQPSAFTLNEQLPPPIFVFKGFAR